MRSGTPTTSKAWRQSIHCLRVSSVPSPGLLIVRPFVSRSWWFGRWKLPQQCLNIPELITKMFQVFFGYPLKAGHHMASTP